MSGAIAFKLKAVLHSTAWVYLGHGVFGGKVGTGTIIIPRLHQNVQIRVLRHGLAKIVPNIVIAIIPRPNRTEHIVFDVCFKP